MDVSGKKALIFGGTSGIGLAAATQLAALGCEVIAISRNPDRASDLPAGITTRACDVLDTAALTQLFADCAPFDILISSATGGSRAIGPFLDMDLDGFKASFDKLWGYTNVVRLGAHHLTENGAIVLVSGAPARKCQPGQIALSSVGGAVEAFARGIANEIAPRRINVVSPGTIDTPIMALTGDDRAAAYLNMTKANNIPRAGTAEEVGQAIVFLVQNDFVNGTTVDVDGGWLLA